MHDTLEVKLYRPESIDGFEVHRLVESSPPLDPNSVYCNLLQCTHFDGTSICAKLDGQLVGFVSGYLIPSRPNTLFIWQVVVAERGRGQGLAGRMLDALLEHPECGEVEYIETTITPSNTASQALFKKFGATHGAEPSITEGFDRKLHFKDHHESEELWRIGPFQNTKTRLLT
ncbi:L-2,4-diaminobutyric acid acetyltransferase [Pontiella sulfatireligans]|uniref:L-2,4-diaminobutyric acid acetyltransferase n=1 Tax=Pontiella sulfatireligans TaxID=2750658 RepID=A0A6C2UP34_9BACT|nr:L-2,4-diaminobutyric acid acetyltransferase [Pontiella sulfatireligans]